MIDRSGQIPLTLSEVSTPRLRRLMERHPELAGWPAFRQLGKLSSAKGETTDISQAEFDALVSLLQLLNAERDLPEDTVDFVLDAVINKARGKQPSQITDFAYEGQVGLLLAASMGVHWTMPVKLRNLPDHVFSLRFFGTDQPTEVAIECKNLHDHPDELRLLIVRVARSIRRAADQHAKRHTGYDDLFIFVDLPVGVLSRPMSDFYALVVNVFTSLERGGYGWIDESQVIFTATGQTNMADHLLTNRHQNRHLTLLRPHTLGKKEVRVSAARAFFLSMLYRPRGETPNIGHWSNVAVSIDAPQAYLVDLTER